MRAPQLALAVLLALSLPAFAAGEDDHGEPHWGPPGHGPRAYHGNPHTYDEHHDFSDGEGHSDYPHVDGDRWIGHDTGRDDDHYRVKHAWEYGHYKGGFGREYVWHLNGGGAGRFRFNGWTWAVAPNDAAYCGNWYWERDSVSIYQDPDHAGWYLAYNLRLGTYVHVMYIGR